MAKLFVNVQSSTTILTSTSVDPDAPVCAKIAPGPTVVLVSKAVVGLEKVQPLIVIVPVSPAVAVLIANPLPWIVDDVVVSNSQFCMVADDLVRYIPAPSLLLFRVVPGPATILNPSMVTSATVK